MTGPIRLMTMAVAGASLLMTAACAQNPMRDATSAAAAATMAAPAAAPAKAPAPMLDQASGIGHVPRTDEEWVTFEAKHAYAYSMGSGATKQVILFLTTKPAADLQWRTEKFYDVVGDWAEKNETPYILISFDDKGAPDLILQTAGTKVYRTERAFVDGKVNYQASLEINDGQRLRGRLSGGVGNCGSDPCEKRHDYAFDVSVVQ